MRPFEALLLGALLLTLLAWSTQRLCAGPWVRLLASSALLAALVQAAVEGPRWQVVPAYALTAVLFALVMRKQAATTSESAWRKRASRWINASWTRASGDRTLKVKEEPVGPGGLAEVD